MICHNGVCNLSERLKDGIRNVHDISFTTYSAGVQLTVGILTIDLFSYHMR